MKLKLILMIIICILMNSFTYAEEHEPKGFISGKVLLPSGKPMKHAGILFYAKQNGPPPNPERYWRVPDSMVLSGSDGKFTVDLLEGEYYVGAIGRESSVLVPGPPEEGDILVLAKEKNGNPKIFPVSNGKTVRLGTQRGLPYHKTVKKDNNKTTTIEGIITKQDGTPASGFFVFAFLSAERGSHPVFASEKTDNRGKYVLRLDGEGTYYLKARDTYGGGKPRIGQFIGEFGGDIPVPVSIDTGRKLSGIDIIVNKIQRPN